MNHTVFIDGQHGTTGLQIMERLQERSDIGLIEIPGEKRRDTAARKDVLNAADVAILCLPDDAAREAVGLIDNDTTRVIDASSAHRTADGWVYGLPELAEQRDKIKSAMRVSNPGCYPTGFLIMATPLVQQAIIPATYPAAIYAITGYSGGGKAMIAAFENTPAGHKPDIACRPKNLMLGHKHLPEMWQHSGLQHTPHFVPIVGDFSKGMLVFFPLHKHMVPSPITGRDVRDTLASYYDDEPFVSVELLRPEEDLHNGFLSPLGCNDTNNVEIFITETDDQLLLVARLDNLGKGASGAAVQNLNLMLGLPENAGLCA